jgi:uncharacterized membrane protein
VRREVYIAAAVFAATALLILGAAVLCTWAIAHGASMQWRSAFRLMCHGIPRRCLTLWSVPMPICARCTAIYAGMVGGIAFFLAAWRLLDERWMRRVAVAGLIPMVLDGGTQALRLRESTNGLRIGTGFAASFFFLVWVLTLLHTELARGPETATVQNDARTVP